MEAPLVQIPSILLQNSVFLEVSTGASVLTPYGGLQKLTQLKSWCKLLISKTEVNYFFPTIIQTADSFSNLEQ